MTSLWHNSVALFNTVCVCCSHWKHLAKSSKSTQTSCRAHLTGAEDSSLSKFVFGFWGWSGRLCHILHTRLETRFSESSFTWINDSPGVRLGYFALHSFLREHVYQHTGHTIYPTVQPGKPKLLSCNNRKYSHTAQVEDYFFLLHLFKTVLLCATFTPPPTVVRR